MLEVADTLKSGWITTGPKTQQFEAAFGNRVGASSALGLNSCTAGLHLGLMALGIRPGDEVITTPMTFCACANVIEHLGATPVLVDVEPDTLNLCPKAVEAAITPRTKAILAVHYAGHPVDLDPIEEIARINGIAVIEDAAHALPASYKGRLIGSGDNPVAFSFYATKNLTTGEGGMLTGSAELIARARTLGLHGMSRDAWKRYGHGGSWFYEVNEPGFKYNMTDVQAAMGLAQLRKLDRFQARRREVVAAYTNAFENIDALEAPTERPEVEHAWHLYVLRLRLGALRIERNQFIDELTARNIGTSVHFIPIHIHPFYQQKYGYQPTQLPVAYESYQRMLSLPLHPMLTDADVSDVISAVLDIVQRFGR
ncbi:MAG: DegT/DnrJ/EryC1/StrS family aminotransferase [Gemmatimonadales bacterium]|nr:DegT/DnrJ/EryC1/StrS family aminotransferase [Gemmatimonadales bacterium]